MKFWNSAFKDMRDMPASTTKPLCVFLLNRYLGDFILERHLSIEQLSVDIFKGKGSLFEVDLNVSHINEMLGGSNAPFRLVDGFVHQVTLQIPWGRVLEESCDVEISGLELTVEVTAAPPAEAANSLLESVIDSMNTSLALARSFVEEQSEKESSFSLQTDAERFEGLGTLAQFIDTRKRRFSFRRGVLIRFSTLRSSCTKSLI
ncbi:unnamed protein product [Soboliphyme baturini]|uniref:Autophagy-related protein 2 n=1 Tax=Soboliphyme baturini TaxID=241478 RepID=A0A183INX8_9BILA|nr:unnamed protein product [Soboliphyme baturini]